MKSRKGLTVEVGNTDAEGRLILADALALAVEHKPDLILDFATLTGAARIALGPDLPALFVNDEDLAHGLLDSGTRVSDPLWRMPLWKPYDEMLASDVADLGNVSDAPLAGAVTAALFLQRFVPEGVPWAHFDTFAWRAAARPGRPKGGDALGLRAAWEMLKHALRALSILPSRPFRIRRPALFDGNPGKIETKPVLAGLTPVTSSLHRFRSRTVRTKRLEAGCTP